MNSAVFLRFDTQEPCTHGKLFGYDLGALSHRITLLTADPCPLIFLPGANQFRLKFKDPFEHISTGEHSEPHTQPVTSEEDIRRSSTTLYAHGSQLDKGGTGVTEDAIDPGRSTFFNCAKVSITRCPQIHEICAVRSSSIAASKSFGYLRIVP